MAPAADATPGACASNMTLRGVPKVYAYGDTAEEGAMLEMAHDKYFRWQKAA